MSVNFVVFGERRIQFELPSGQSSTEMQNLRIETIRLGTEISEKLFNSGDTDDSRLAAYIDHVASHAGKKIQTVAVYAPGTDAHDGFPLYFIIITHFYQNLSNFYKNCMDKSYDNLHHMIIFHQLPIKFV